MIRLDLAVASGSIRIIAYTKAMSTGWAFQADTECFGWLRAFLPPSTIKSRTRQSAAWRGPLITLGGGYHFTHRTANCMP